MTTKTKKQLSDGAIIGRALTKLQQLDAAEATELETTPAAIRQKFHERRGALLADLPAPIRAAVIAANKAARGTTEAAAE